MDSYLDGLSGQIEPETLTKYRHDAQTVAGWFPGKTLQSLTRADVRTQVASLNLSRKRLLNLLTPLRGALEQALDDEAIETNPLAAFRVRKVAASDDEVIDPFTREEIDRLGRTELGYLWRFWAWAGPRSGELIGFVWGDVGVECEDIEVRRSVRVGRKKAPKTKAGKRRLILLPEARAALHEQERRDDHDAVFTNPNTGKWWYEDRALARAFRNACAAVDVRYRYPYQLRHTFASWALSTGENPLWVAKYMGHRDVATIFRVYGKYIPEMNPEAGKKMSARVA